MPGIRVWGCGESVNRNKIYKKMCATLSVAITTLSIVDKYDLTKKKNFSKIIFMKNINKNLIISLIITI